MSRYHLHECIKNLKRFAIICLTNLLFDNHSTNNLQLLFSQRRMLAMLGIWCSETPSRYSPGNQPEKEISNAANDKDAIRNQ